MAIKIIKGKKSNQKPDFNFTKKEIKNLNELAIEEIYNCQFCCCKK